MELTCRVSGTPIPTIKIEKDPPPPSKLCCFPLHFICLSSVYYLMWKNSKHSGHSGGGGGEGVRRDFLRLFSFFFLFYFLFLCLCFLYFALRSLLCFVKFTLLSFPLICLSSVFFSVLALKNNKTNTLWFSRQSVLVDHGSLKSSAMRMLRSSAFASPF